MPHAFISYVRENRKQVSKLAQDLNDSGIDTWTDAKILPGQRWKKAIRNAIRDGAAFIACFSPELVNRSSSYMNEEITLAIEMCRMMPQDRCWFIPVLLGDCEIPDRDIGGGEQLNDIQSVPLYKDWDRGIELISTLLADSLRYHPCEQLSSEPRLPALRTPPTFEQIRAWKSVWKQLFKLKIAGDEIITKLTSRTLKKYAKRLVKSVNRVGETAFFFDKEDYDEINKVLRISLNLRVGKESLWDLREFEMSRRTRHGAVERDIAYYAPLLGASQFKEPIQHQISENVGNHELLCKTIQEIHERYSQRVGEYRDPQGLSNHDLRSDVQG